MSQSHLTKRLKARETSLTVSGHAYTLRRPTALDRARMAGESPVDIVRACVVGWDLTLLDLIPGGDPTPAPFTPELWGDWLSDTPEIWKPLADAVADLVRAHDAELERAEKN